MSFDARDSDRFYVTVAIRGRPYLARGSVAGAAVETLRPDVECPSLSPDGTRIAFKKRRPGQRGWDPAARGVDDQIEWLDNETILYEATQTRMGEAKVDLMLRDVRRPPTPERAWVEDAASPAVLRGGPVPSPGAARASAARP